MANYNDLYANNVITNNLRSSDSSINIGTTSTSSVFIGKTGVNTEVKGALSVNEGVYISNTDRNLDEKNGYGLLYKKREDALAVRFCLNGMKFNKQKKHGLSIKLL